MVHAWYKNPGVINRDMARESNLRPVGPEIPEKLLAVTDYLKDELEKVVNIRSNFISRTGKEFYDIYPVWDWQKIPGTTVVQKPELPHWNQIVKQGKTDFVG